MIYVFPDNHNITILCPAFKSISTVELKADLRS